MEHKNKKEKTMGSVKKLRAKFAGKCLKCGGGVTPGDFVFWQQGVGVWHLSCAPDGVLDAGETMDIQKAEREEAERVAKFKAMREDAMERGRERGRKILADALKQKMKFESKPIEDMKVRTFQEWKRSPCSLCQRTISGEGLMAEEGSGHYAHRHCIETVKKLGLEEGLKAIAMETRQREEQEVLGQAMTNDMRRDFENLGWANGWRETPEVVKKCQEAGHQAGNICYICKYSYQVDSSG